MKNVRRKISNLRGKVFNNHQGHYNNVWYGLEKLRGTVMAAFELTNRYA